MLYSLVICTVIYIITALVITGLVNYKEFLNIADPLAYVFDKIHLHKIGFIISVAAVVASTSVLLVFQIGQPRIWMSMSRDGLMPPAFSRISKRFKTPGFATLVTGLLVGIPVLVVDDKLMTDLTSIGTLFAFVLVCSGVLYLPALNQKIPGKFKLPYLNGKFIVPLMLIGFLLMFRTRFSDALTNLGAGDQQEILFLLFVLAAVVISVFTFIRNYSVIPVLGTLFCLYLMIEIPAKSWMVFFIWMGIGLAIYLLYGRRKSKLGKIPS
jgi:amino acid transporter